MNLDLFRMGYFILYRKPNGFDLFGTGIKKRQILAGFEEDDASYVHIEVSGGEIHSINISPPISKLIKITEKHKGRYIKVVRYKNADYELKGRYKVAYFSATLCNLGYDIAGILRFIFKWIKQSNRLYFCSEGAAWALSQVYPDSLGMPNEKVMPVHFTDKEKFEIVWEGEIPK